MVVRMRHTKSHTGNRRSHHKIETASLTLCKECGSPKAQHVVCKVCGKYKGRQVLNVLKKASKVEKKAKAAKSSK